MPVFFIAVLVLAGLPLLAWVVSRTAPHLCAQILVQFARRLAGLRDRVQSVGDHQIVFSEGGSGEPLLLLHGLGAGRTSFEAAAAFLAKQCHLIIPDLPGFGDSSRVWDADYGIDAQVERMDQFVTALGLERFHLGGNSMGGWIAAAYAARFPGKVKSLWLIAAAGTEDMLATEAIVARQERGEYRLLARNSQEFQGVIDRIFYRKPPLPYCIRVVGAERAAADFALHAKIFDQLLERGQDYRLEPHLPQIKIPTQLLWGEHDTVVPLSVMATFHRLLPNAEVCLLPDVGHVPQMEAPRLSVARYLKFRAALAGA